MDAICLGELIVDFLPSQRGVGLGESSTFNKQIGGAPANVAVGLAQLGCRSAFMGMVGDDPFGHFLSQGIRERGVDVGALRFSSAAPTGLAFVSLQSDGEREFLFYRSPSADTLFQAGDVDEALIRSARLLHFGSITLIAEPTRFATRHAISVARETGCSISFDVNLRRNLWPSMELAEEQIRMGLSEAEIVKMSDDELGFLTDIADPIAAVHSIWHDRLKLVLVSCGERGSLFVTPTFSGKADSFPVTPVDTTGAGDSFMAAILAGILGDPGALSNRQAMVELCRFANAAGALTTTCEGAITAMPTRQSVEQLMAASAS